jgi:glycine reductase
VLKELEKEGKIRAIHPYFYSTTGNVTTLKESRRMGEEIAQTLESEHVDGAILVST